MKIIRHQKGTPVDMKMFQFVAVVVLSLTLYQNAHGSFTSAPTDITPKKTKDLTLRCQPMSKEGAVLAIHIKKKEDLPVAIDTDEEGKIDVLGGLIDKGEEQDSSSNDRKKREYPDDNREKRDAEDEDKSEHDFVRATMTSGSKIDVVPDNERFKAEGNIDDDAYLSVKILDPDESDLGLYECQVTFFDSSGSIQVTSETATVEEAMALTLDSLEDRVNALEDHLPVILAVSEVVQKTVQEAKSNNLLMQQDVEALKKENKQLVATIADLTTDLHGLETKLTAIAAGQRGSSYDSKDSKDYKQQTFNANDQYGGEFPSDQLFKVNQRMDELENTRIHVLEQQMDVLKGRQMDVEDRVDSMEITINDTMSEKIKALQSLDWSGLAESLQNIEVKTLPVLMRNISDFQRQISVMQKSVKLVMAHAQISPQEIMELMQSFQPGSPQAAGTKGSSSNETETAPEAAGGSSTSAPQENEETTTAADETTATTTMETTPTAAITTTTATTTTLKTTTVETVPHFSISCYVCGDNATQEPCTSKTSQNVGQCPEKQPYCITDVYQDDRHRHLYRRCGTIQDCQKTVQNSESDCATDNFLIQTAMKCHFCCSSNLCNDSIRPSVDLYKG